MEEQHDALSSGFASVLNNTQKKSKEMIKIKKNELLELKNFFILWSTQCDFKDFHSPRAAGACVCMPQHPPIFYHSHRVVFGRFYGRQYMRTIYGKIWGNIHSKNTLWLRQGLRCGPYDVCTWRSRMCDLHCHREEIKEVSVYHVIGPQI